MKEQQAKELLPVITALANGETIQWLNAVGSAWNDTSDPHFELPLPSSHFRIKPETPEIPKQLEVVNIDKLSIYADYYMKNLAEGRSTKDVQQYMFEAVMWTLYGPNIFKWINDHDI